MRRILCLMLMVIMTVPVCGNQVLAWEEAKAVFDDVTSLTSEEIVAEMKYAVATGKNGSYYPKDRLHQLEQQLAKNQAAEIERFKKQLKNDAEVAKQIEKLKQKALDKVKEKSDAWIEANKDAIQKEVEEQARMTLGFSSEEWNKQKDNFNDMYDKGSKYYEDNLESYVEDAKYVLDLYNTYQGGKTKHPEAPEAAQNLVGFLDATGKLLNSAGEKMDKTPLRPIGEILKMYGAATGLGDTAAKAAWEYAHREGISGIYNTQYSDGLNKAGMSDFDLGGIQKSNLMMFDKNLRILKLSDGYVVFNDKFEVVPGAFGNKLTQAEYDKLEQIYTSFQNGREGGWPNLTAEQLAQLARGDKIKVTVDDNMWPFSDDIREFDASAILALGEKHADQTIREDTLISIDRILNGELNLITGLIDPFTRLGRRREINALLSDFYKLNGYEDSFIHNREAFLEWVKALKEENEGLSSDELKKLIKEELKRRLEEKEGKSEDEEEEEDDKNPLEEALEEIDPEVTGADASGVKTGDEDEEEGGHWTQETPEDFNGVKDGGFTNTGGTNRPMPGGGSPQSIGIPVLKPNIYLYPEETQMVKVTFLYPQRLTEVIPSYEHYWQVEAAPNGLLDGTYGFLFYEAIVQESLFQQNHGWVLSVDNRVEDFESMLNLYGFNATEQKDFIEFWQGRLCEDISYAVYPQGTRIIDQAMPVEVMPEPDRSYRIWFYYIPYDGQAVVEPETVEFIERQGFTLVEWGGMFK